MEGKFLKYWCPKCGGSAYYEIDEQKSPGAIGVKYDLPGEVDPVLFKQYSYKEKVKKCRNCDLKMNQTYSNKRERNADVIGWIIGIGVVGLLCWGWLVFIGFEF